MICTAEYKKRRIWKSRQQWLEYGRRHGYNKLSRTKLQETDSGYYSKGREEDWLDFIISKRLHRIWKSKNQWLEYGRQHGYYRLTRVKLARQDGPYYYSGLKRGWIDDLIPHKLRRYFKSKGEWLKYGRKMGYHKLSRMQLEEKDSGYYGKGRRERWLDKLIPKTLYRLWGSKQKWLNYGRKKGYDKLSRGELKDKDVGYYGTGFKKGWLDDLIPKPIKTANEVKEYIAKEPAAKRILEIASLNRSYGDVAQIFTELWPERFPSAETLSKQLPGIIPKITPAIAPFKVFQIAFRELYELLPVESIPRNLQDLIYRIGVDTYQAEFNRDPKRTLENLQNLKRTVENKAAREMVGRVYSWYKEVYGFYIPGAGRLSERYS